MSRLEIQEARMQKEREEKFKIEKENLLKEVDENDFGKDDKKIEGISDINDNARNPFSSQSSKAVQGSKINGPQRSSREFKEQNQKKGVLRKRKKRGEKWDTKAVCEFLISLFFRKQNFSKFPMFHFKKRKAEYDDYGEIINPEDYSKVTTKSPSSLIQI